MTRALFHLLVVLALLGDARIALFVINRGVFGSHRREANPYTLLLWVVPPFLLTLTALFVPLGRWLGRWLAGTAIEPDAIERLGAIWLLVAAPIGIYWIVDRLRARMAARLPVSGTRTHEPVVIRMRKAHVPFAWLRNLGAHNDLYDLEITRHEVFVDGLPRPFDGYRIAFLTDMHVAPFMRRGFYREIAARVRQFDPDLVLLGGDFVTWRRHTALMAELVMGGLEARDGVFAVLGNHDYWAGATRVREALEERGVRFLINRSVTLTRDDARIRLVGIDELYRGEPDLDAAFAGVDPREPCLAVSHHPDIIELAADHRIDLLVCGHTHGGQIRFPFFGAVVVPSRHEAEYASGFHRLRHALMYVSRGIGAVPPVRILCRPEVATFVLRRSEHE